MKKSMLAIMAIAMLNQNAIAGGDIVPVEPVSVTEGHWNGFYLGGQLGYDWGQADLVTYETVFGLTFPYPTKGLDTLGFTGGIYGGYNWLFDNNYLVGIEGAWNYINANGEQHISNAFAGWTHTVEQDWDASLLLKAGKVMGDYLPYVTGGASWTKINLKTFNPLWGMYYDDADTTLSGWSIGAGIEMILSDHYHARIQYLYTSYSDKSLTITQNYDPDFTYSSDVDYSNQALTIGISYQF